MKNDRPIIKQEELSLDKVQLTLFVDDSLVYFQGHFEDAPVLPGVVQLNWAIFYAKQYLNLLGDVVNVDVLKFQKLLKPNSTVKLTLEKKASNKFVFSFTYDEEKYSSGRILLN